MCTNNGTVRLSNGNSSNEGRVEICLNGYWGTICSNGWNEIDAFVTCKQAGYETLSQFILSMVIFIIIDRSYSSL